MKKVRMDEEWESGSCQVNLKSSEIERQEK